MATDKTSIVIGSDHAGFALKADVIKALGKMRIGARDVGTHSAHEPTDYPGYAAKVAEAVASGMFERGILVCGTGMGTSIVANRFPHVRAVVCTNVAMAITARAKLDCNVLVLGSGYTHELEIFEILKTFLNTKFEGGRHARRIKLIDDNQQLAIALGHLDQLNPKNLDHKNVNAPVFLRAIKGFEKIARAFARTERRDEPAARQAESCPTTFFVEGEKYKSLMVNMSEQGAQLQISVTGKLPQLIRDDILELSIKTPCGMSQCKGSVRWFDQNSGHLGISFVDFPTDQNDPLRSLAEAMM